MHLAIITGSGNGNGAPRVLHGDRAARVKRLHRNLLTLMLITQKLVQVVRIQHEVTPKWATPGADQRAERNPRHRQQKQQEHHA